MFRLMIRDNMSPLAREILNDPNVNVINLSLRRFKNDSFGVEIAIGIETHAMALFVDFDPDIDFDGFSSHENFLS